MGGRVKCRKDAPNGHCFTKQSLAPSCGPICRDPAQLQPLTGSTVHSLAALSIKFSARTWRSRKEAVLPRVSSGNFPGGKTSFARSGSIQAAGPQLGSCYRETWRAEEELSRAAASQRWRPSRAGGGGGCGSGRTRQWWR